MHRLTSVFIPLIIACCCAGNSSAQTACCTSRYHTTRWDTLGLQKLGAEYARLKRANCEDCRSSMSDYPSIMDALGKGLNGRTRRQIAKIMGQPDSRKDGQYIYFWRGWHDYLYFTFSSGKGYAQWYYALE